MERMPSGRDKWLVVALLFLVGVINYADRTSITALYTLLKTDLGFSDVGIGALGSLFLWSYALASPFAGHLGDRINRGSVVIWSLAGWSLVMILTGLTTTRGQLLAMRAVLGLVESLYLPAALALVAEYHDFATRAKAQSMLSVGQYLGMVAGGTLAGFLGEQQGWRSPALRARRGRPGACIDLLVSSFRADQIVLSVQSLGNRKQGSLFSQDFDLWCESHHSPFLPGPEF